MTCEITTEKPRYAVKQPKNLSPRIQWLRDYYFQGVQRRWNNEFTSWTTGTAWDFQYNELTFYIVPETYFYLQTFRSSFKQTARKVDLHPDFWCWSLPERRAWFVKEVMVHYLPQGAPAGRPDRRGALQHHDLLLPERTGSQRIRAHGASARTAPGRACCGSTTTASAIPAPPAGTWSRITRPSWRSAGRAFTPILQKRYQALPSADQQGPKGAQLRAMLTAATMARDLAGEYRQLCLEPAADEADADPQIRAAANGGKPRARPLGAGQQLLGSGAIPVADPHAGDERRELSRPGPVLRAHRPVPVPLLAAFAGRRAWSASLARKS